MENLIFGYTLNQIKTAQQGQPLKRPLPPKENGAENDICLPGDVRLLIDLGLKAVEDRGYYNVIDRLSRAGIIEQIQGE